MEHGQPIINRPEPSGARPPNRRRCGRFRQQSLRCNLGRIVDVSATGLRLRRCWPMRKGATWSIAVKDHALGGPLVGRVTWCRRVGFFAHEVGMEFVDVQPQVAHELATVAGCAGLPRFDPAMCQTLTRIV